MGSKAHSFMPNLSSAYPKTGLLRVVYWPFGYCVIPEYCVLNEGVYPYTSNQRYSTLLSPNGTGVRQTVSPATILQGHDVPGR